MFSTSIDTALRLPALDVAALLQGRTVAALVWRALDVGEKFALYPSGLPGLFSAPAELYRPSFLRSASSFSRCESSENVRIRAWAKCEFCLTIDDSAALETFSQLTIWTQQAFEKILAQRPYLFIACLRVYNLPQPLEMVARPGINFVPLPQVLTVTEESPSLGDRLFIRRAYQLKNCLPPAHLELEDLQAELVSLTAVSAPAEQFDKQIQAFLGWQTESSVRALPKELDWMRQIAALGNRSHASDEGKSNYQAGTDFEDIVKKSLEFLGFKIDHFHRGGAGGVDVFCSQPYPLICECKAGQKIPNTTAVQLLNLGTLRLPDKAAFERAAKLIIGPGTPTPQLKEAAIKQGMAILNPETLEKLVELQALYPNCVDLFELKAALKAGDANTSIAELIAGIKAQIGLRSHVLQVLRRYLENSGFEKASVDALSGAYSMSNPPEPLSPQALHEILVELSSPLTGYAGRIKGGDWRRDRFYFLREL